jgi:hypothetical protein
LIRLCHRRERVPKKLLGKDEYVFHQRINNAHYILYIISLRKNGVVAGPTGD